MQTTLVTAPTGMLISLDDAKAHLRVDHTSEDGYIQSLIMAAISQAETITRRKLLTQTWKAFYEDWPDEYFRLPYGQLQSVTHVKYTDSDATQTTWDSGEYIVDTDSDPGRVVLGYSESWPNETLYPSLPIEIQFVCGYGDHTLQTITGATNASPIVVTSAAHGLVTGNRVLIADVLGNTNTNGAWNITKVTDNTFSLDGSTGNAAYTSGGTLVHLEVPEPIRHAIKLILSDMYEHRQSIYSGVNVAEIPGHIMNLLWDYRIWL